MSNPADAGTFQAAVAAPVVLNTLTAAQGVTGVNDANYFVLDKSTPGNPGAGPLVPMPLPLIQALSGLGLPAAPTVYVNGKNFVFVIVGEAGQPSFSATDGGGPGDGGDGTVFNTRSPHFIAFPTDPVIEDYKP